MSVREVAVSFGRVDEPLCGILHLPSQPASRGIVMLSARPQYRIGVQRQAVRLARRWAAKGFPVMRFDYGGMGDSLGEELALDQVDHDVSAALDTLFSAVSHLRQVALWGLCGGASLAAVYAGKDSRVRGVSLVNPLVLDEKTAGRTRLKNYYWSRLRSPDLWWSMLRGRFKWGHAFGQLRQSVHLAMGKEKEDDKEDNNGHAASPGILGQNIIIPTPLYQWGPQVTGLTRSRVPVLLILCGKDLVAQVYQESAMKSPAWQKLTKTNRITRHDLPDAEHTFPSDELRDQVAGWTIDWLGTW